jgi:hypothetical protein
MKTKHKRLIIIGLCIAWGVFALYKPFVSSRVEYPKESHIFELICIISCQAAIKVYFKLNFDPMLTIISIYKALFIIQFFIYAGLGTIISCLIYPPWRKTKSLAKSTISLEPNQ